MPHKDPEKRKARQKAYYEANKDKRNAQNKAYREAWYEANKDKIKAHYEANKDKIKAHYEANKDKILAKSKAYYEANRAYYIEKAIFRRKLLNKLQRPKWYDPKLVNKIYNECHKLNKIAGFIKYHVDHIVPLQGKNVSGLHVQDNLQIILASVNLSKSNKYEVDTT